MRILKLQKVKEKSGKCRSSIYQGVKDGTFPAPIKLGERGVGWIESEVDNWIEARIKASRNGGAK